MKNFVTMDKALAIADERKIALGAFEFWSYEVARAIVKAAEEADVPVIMQCGKSEIDRMGGMRETVETAYMAAKNSTVPVVLHLDHATTFELCNEAINAGFSSVMIDASALPLEENIALTKKVSRRAHAAGISVEGELGRLVGEEGDIKVGEPEAAQTNPDEALYYVNETKVDALAVSIGTAHGEYSFEPKLNILRLDEIKKKINVPIVLHGGSGTPMSQVQESIKHGVRKVNICTDIQIAMGTTYKNEIVKEGFKYSAENLWGAAEKAAKEVVKQKINAFAFLN